MLRREPGGASMSSARRAIAFVDLCAYSRFTRTHGDHAAAAIIVQLRRVVTRHAAEHRTDLVGWTGDGAVLMSADAAVLARCCRAIIDEVCACTPLALRGGLAIGDVLLLGDGDVIGSTVNRAAELCQYASPATLVADEPPPMARRYHVPRVEPLRGGRCAVSPSSERGAP